MSLDHRLGGLAPEISKMASSRAQGPTKRLLTELQTYQSDPNDALLELGPIDDDDLLHWRAVMRGVEGTAYEGAYRAAFPLPCIFATL